MNGSYMLPYLHQTQPDSVYVCFESREHEVIMYRHAPDYRLGETADTFTVRDARTGEILGDGDTKEEANNDAQYRLMDNSRKAFEQQQTRQAA